MDGETTSALARVRAHPGGTGALSLLSRVYMNVLTAPDEPKYRTLRRANAALATQLFAVPGAEVLLRALGFAPNDAGDAFVAGELGEAEAAVATDVMAAADELAAAAPPRAAAATPPPRAPGGGLGAEERAAALAASAKKLADAAAERARVAAAARADQEERRARDAAKAPQASRRTEPAAARGVTRFNDIGVDLNKPKGG